MAPNVGGKVYIVEHLDPELGPWSELEYVAIAQESQDSGSSFTLSSLPHEFKVPESLKAIPTFKATQNSVENIYAATKTTVCLLDPAAEKDISPEDAQEFGTFLFGGILGESRTCLNPGCWMRKPLELFTTLTHPQAMIPLEVFSDLETFLPRCQEHSLNRARPNVRVEKEGLPGKTSRARSDDHGHGCPCDQDGDPAAE